MCENKKNEFFMPIYKKISSLKDLPTVRQLRAFMAVYETGSMSSAADLLALTQPAVTLLLRELEQKLGVQLFDRTTRALQHTEAASEAYVYAERVFAELNEMSASLSGLANGQRGHIHIAATSTLAQTLLPPVVSKFKKEWPQVRVTIDDCSPAEFVELIGSGRVTFGVGTLEKAMANVEEKVFFEDALVAVSIYEKFSSSKRPIRWAQLATYPVIAVKPGYGVRRHIDTAAANAGVMLNIEYEVSLLSTALAMAASGLGVAVVPESVMVHCPFRNLVARRLSNPVVFRNTAVIHARGKSLSAAAKGFIDLLIQSTQQQPSS